MGNFKIIDFHTHIGDIFNGFETVNPPDEKPFRLFEFLYEKMGFTSPLPGKQPDWLRVPLVVEIQLRFSWAIQARLLESMEKNGISAAVVHPVEPYSSTEKIFRDADAHKNLIVFASVDPRDPQRLEKLKKYEHMGCKGLKLHPIIQRTSPEDRAYFEIVDAYQKYGKPVLFHTGEFDYYLTKTHYPAYGKVELHEKIIASFPKVNFVLGHCGLHTPEPAVALAQKYRNVYLETSFQSLKSLHNIFSKVEKTRILFGSDWPSAFQEPHIKVMRKATAGDNSLAELVFHKNAEQLLGI